jgi:hypothetical protein
MKIAAVLVLFLSSLAWAAPGKGALDKATLENYLRHLELFRGDVTFRLDDPKPSKDLPGYSEVLVHLIFNSAEKEELFYVSADGQTILRGDVYNLGKSPFQSNLDKLTVTGQPSFGPADAPVTIVEFGDFECPDCKMEAPILRHDLADAYSTKVRCIPGRAPRPSRVAACIDRDSPRSGSSTIGFTRSRIRSLPTTSKPKYWRGAATTQSTP